MNGQQRTKIRALAECRMWPDHWGVAYVRSMAWLAEHEPGTPLSGRQRYTLDRLVYEFRRQLAGATAFEVLAEPPVESDYVRIEPGPAQFGLF